MSPSPIVRVGPVEIGNRRKMALIAGPCQLESRAHALEMASALKEIAAKAGVGLIYKTSFDKANRTSAVRAARAWGLRHRCRSSPRSAKVWACRVLTDVHEREQCAVAGRSGGRAADPRLPLPPDRSARSPRPQTGKVVNVKKGQFLAPWDMKNVIAKITDAGNPNVLVTERGTSFGYNTLVVDMTGLPEMAKFGAPVVIDATHAVQKPGGQGDLIRRQSRDGALCRARGRGGGCRRRLHGDASGSGPRAVRRAEHDPAQGLAGAACRTG